MRLARSDKNLARTGHRTLDISKYPGISVGHKPAGPVGETTTNDFDIQSVYPVGLGKVTLINRVILPISYQE